MACKYSDRIPSHDIDRICMNDVPLLLQMVLYAKIFIYSIIIVEVSVWSISLSLSLPPSLPLSLSFSLSTLPLSLTQHKSTESSRYSPQSLER